MRRTSDSKAPDLPLAFMHSFCLSFKSCISYALRPRLVSVFPPMYQLHGILSPTLSLLLFMYHIHGPMLPSLFSLFFMYQVEYSAPHREDTSR